MTEKEKEDLQKSEQYTLEVAKMAYYIIQEQQYELLIRLLGNYDLLMKGIEGKLDQDLPFWAYDDEEVKNEVQTPSTTE